MMKKSYVFFVLILTNLFGQPFTGLVKDISGEPIPYVIVEEINSNIEEKNWAISDENGVFTINVENNSKLSFQRIGFQNNIVELNSLKGKSVVMLNENIELDKVDVYGSNNDCLLYTSPSPRD